MRPLPREASHGMIGSAVCEVLASAVIRLGAEPAPPLAATSGLTLSLHREQVMDATARRLTWTLFNHWILRDVNPAELLEDGSG